MSNVRAYNYHLKGFDEIYDLSQTLARHFPRPDHCATGIYELLLNAVEHGNLGIGFAKKTELIRQGQWKKEVARRLALSENAEKEVTISLVCNNKECRLTIADQGKGFSWKDFAGRPADKKTPNGRGLWIAFNSKFDRIMFNPAGNEVTCITEFRHWKAD